MCDLRRASAIHLEKNTGQVEIVREGKLETVYFRKSGEAVEMAERFFAMQRVQDQVYWNGVPAKELPQKLEDFMETSHSIIFDLKHTLRLVKYFRNSEVKKN